MMGALLVERPPAQDEALRALVEEQSKHMVVTGTANCARSLNQPT